MKKYTWLFFILLLLISVPLIVLVIYFVPDNPGDWLYDLRHKNPPVSSRAEVDRILSGFQRIPLAKMPAGQRKQSGLSDVQEHRPDFFYVLRPRDLHRRIIGNNRLGQLVSRDLRPGFSFFASEQPVYLGIDPDIIYKAIELQELLGKNGYNPYGLTITSGHRTPKHNKSVRGASGSRHQRGDALDLRIGDIDRNGWATNRDKQIVWELLNNRVIGQRGGIGNYPGTQILHVDLRGRGARWQWY